MLSVGRWIGRHAALFAAGIAFIESLILAATDHVAGASVTGALALTAVLVHNLPIVESLKIFSVEARLRRRIDEAEQLLGKIRELAIVSSRQMFLQLGWMNRWGTASLLKKIELTDQLTSLLRGLDVTSTEISSATEPFIRFIGVDLYHVYYAVLSKRVHQMTNALHKERENIFGRSPINMSDPRYENYKDLSAKLNELHTYLHRPNEFDNQTRPLNLRSALADSKQPLLPLDDQQKLTLLREEVCELYKECCQLGNITERARKFLEENDDSEHPKKLKELFG